MCLCSFLPESNWGANAGLAVARDLLEPVKQKHPWISYSDLWTLAGATAIEAMGGEQQAAGGLGHAWQGSEGASARLAIPVPAGQPALLPTLPAAARFCRPPHPLAPWTQRPRSRAVCGPARWPPARWRQGCKARARHLLQVRWHYCVVVGQGRVGWLGWRAAAECSAA